MNLQHYLSITGLCVTVTTKKRDSFSSKTNSRQDPNASSLSCLIRPKSECTKTRLQALSVIGATRRRLHLTRELRLPISVLQWLCLPGNVAELPAAKMRRTISSHNKKKNAGDYFRAAFATRRGEDSTCDRPWRQFRGWKKIFGGKICEMVSFKPGVEKWGSCTLKELSFFHKSHLTASDLTSTGLISSVIGRNHGELGRALWSDPVRRGCDQSQRSS